jgi:hypothetical protein
MVLTGTRSAWCSDRAVRRILAGIELKQTANQNKNFQNRSRSNALYMRRYAAIVGRVPAVQSTAAERSRLLALAVKVFVL